jgi:mono/diheme cytochrome c family protein
MKRTWLSIIALLAVLTLAACGSTSDSEAAESGGDVAAGEQLFNTGGASGIPCASCHTLDGTELVGPSLQGIAERAAEREPGTSAEDYIHQSIVTPSAYLVAGYENNMNNNYGETLSEADINNLVAFLMTQ